MRPLIAFDGAKLTGEHVFDVGASSSSIPANGTRKLVDGAVLKVLENLITFVDEVNDRPVGNPKRRFDEYSSKFSLSYETKVINPIGKSQTAEGDAR
jgi:hypothetical protein